MHYRGRIAPSPTGLLHIGHACTFWMAYQRAVANRGTLVFRNEDLDPQRSKADFARAMVEDLHWIGIKWQEGPDIGGPFGPYEQSARRNFYLDAWRTLRDRGFLYPCTCSRKDLASATAAPNEGDDEPTYSGRCRNRIGDARKYEVPAGVNWRFRVPDGETIAFDDMRPGPTTICRRRRLWRLRRVAARRCSGVSACSGSGRPGHADNRSRARRRPAEIYRAPVAADSRAGLFGARLLSLSTWCGTKPEFAWPSATMRSACVHCASKGLSPEEVLAKCNASA